MATNRIPRNLKKKKHTGREFENDQLFTGITSCFPLERISVYRLQFAIYTSSHAVVSKKLPHGYGDQYNEGKLRNTPMASFNRELYCL
jgi:hypothetical protein